MPVRLIKYQALGNDYLVLDLPGPFDELVRSLPVLCHPHFGLGSDGLLAFDPAVLSVRIFNPDGSQLDSSYASGSLGPDTLATAGTYTLVVDPQLAFTGAITLSLAPSAAYASQAQNIHVCGLPGSHAVAPSACTADPVNSLTGAFTDSATDLSLPGAGVTFVFGRSYSSVDTTTGRLGPGWTDSYSASLA